MQFSLKIIFSLFFAFMAASLQLKATASDDGIEMVSASEACLCCEYEIKGGYVWCHDSVGKEPENCDVFLHKHCAADWFKWHEKCPACDDKIGFRDGSLFFIQYAEAPPVVSAPFDVASLLGWTEGAALGDMTPRPSSEGAGSFVCDNATDLSPNSQPSAGEGSPLDAQDEEGAWFGADRDARRQKEKRLVEYLRAVKESGGMVG
jgi:hypothetical protein